MAPSQNLADFLSVMCESVLVGAYAVLIGFVLWILKRGWRSMPFPHKALFGASIFMFLISIVHLGLVMEQVTAPIVPIPNFQTQIVLSVIQFATGDLILIWRVWIIWGRNYWVAVGPLAIMMLAAGFVFNSASLTETRTFFTVAPTALIVANTSICTILIAGKIWYMQFQLRKSGGFPAYSGTYKGAVLLVIESGALYALAQFITLILNRTKSPGLGPMLNLEIPLIGILPTLIILFVHFKMVAGDETLLATYHQSGFRNASERSHTTVNTYNSARENRTEIKSGTDVMASEEYNLSIHVRKDISSVA